MSLFVSCGSVCDCDNMWSWSRRWVRTETGYCSRGALGFGESICRGRFHLEWTLIKPTLDCVLLLSTGDRTYAAIKWCAVMLSVLSTVDVCRLTLAPDSAFRRSSPARTGGEMNLRLILS